MICERKQRISDLINQVEIAISGKFQSGRLGQTTQFGKSEVPAGTVNDMNRNLYIDAGTKIIKGAGVCKTFTRCNEFQFPSSLFCKYLGGRDKGNKFVFEGLLVLRIGKLDSARTARILGMDSA